MKQEIEVKLPIRSPDAVRAALERAGARPHGGSAETNIVWDRGGELAARGELLRLRQDREARLTWKGPATNDAGLKSRIEVETVVADFETCREILSRLGFQPAVSYAKYREVWELGEAEVAIDRLEFGDFVEIEGTAGSIASAAALLGLDLGAALSSNYVELQEAARRGEPRLERFADA